MLRKLKVKVWLYLNGFYNRHICGVYPWEDKM